MRLGIDFGTTRTVVAVATQGRYSVATFETDTGYSEYLPGLAVLKDGRMRLGFEAVEALADSPDAVVRSIKRSASQVPHNEPVAELREHGITALELLTKMMEHLRTMILERSNLDVAPGEPLEAMVAVPANASTRQRYLTMEAFTRAGFHVIGMVNEPTAAAIEFARRHLGVLGRRSPKRYVVVYDLGGGTFDTAAVSLEGRRFELLATEGISKLGGEDFDEIILDYALEATGTVRVTDLDPARRVRLLELCREAKEALSPSSRRLLVDFGDELPGQGPAVLDTTELYTRCQHLVDNTMSKLMEVFEQLSHLGIDPSNPRELGAVYLVGGGTAFPAVPRALRTLYKRKVQLAIQPHAATALGLAVAADPEAQIFVRESTTRHFGVWREAWGGREQVFDQIVNKNAAPAENQPIVVERWYRPIHAIGHLRFLECSSLSPEGQPAGDVIPWGEIYFPYDPELRHHARLDQLRPDRPTTSPNNEIVERYIYTSDGTVAVEIHNRTHGYHKRFLLGELV